MKRRLLIIAICLLLGALVNVAVAWSASISTPTHRALRVYLVDLFPEEQAKVAGNRYDGPTVTLTLLHPWGAGVPRVSTFPHIFVESGWPTRSMEGSMLPDGSLVESYLLTQANVGPVDYRLLPLRPTWPGFAINTLFYAAILWLLWSLIRGPFVLRRFLRRFLRLRRGRRGLCPKCAYPMGESAVCTECGKPLPRRQRVFETGES